METHVGAHIPDLSSEVEFFDLLYLGVFVILSPAFDDRFYQIAKPCPSLVKEIAHTVVHFYSLLHLFSQWFFILLEGEVISPLYVVDRMLREFAAALVVLAKSISKADEIIADVNPEEVEPEDAEPGDEIRLLAFVEHIEGILKKYHPEVFPYYSHCLDRAHKDFLWMGPCVQIFLHSCNISPILSATASGEMWDLPSHPIYTEDLHPSLRNPPDSVSIVGKRQDQGDSPNPEDAQVKKHSQKS